MTRPPDTCERLSCLHEVLSLHISDLALLLDRFLSRTNARGFRTLVQAREETGSGRRSLHLRPRAPPSAWPWWPAPHEASPTRVRPDRKTSGCQSEGFTCAALQRAPLTSVPLSLSSSADCACSILSTRTMSCLTFLLATCAQHSSRESPHAALLAPLLATPSRQRLLVATLEGISAPAYIGGIVPHPAAPFPPAAPPQPRWWSAASSQGATAGPGATARPRSRSEWQCPPALQSPDM